MGLLSRAVEANKGGPACSDLLTFSCSPSHRADGPNTHNLSVAVPSDDSYDSLSSACHPCVIPKQDFELCCPVSVFQLLKKYLDPNVLSVSCFINVIRLILASAFESYALKKLLGFIVYPLLKKKKNYSMCSDLMIPKPCACGENRKTCYLISGETDQMSPPPLVCGCGWWGPTDSESGMCTSFLLVCLFMTTINPIRRDTATGHSVFTVSVYHYVITQALPKEI